MKYITLGSKASLFFDPVTGVKVIGDEVLEVPNKYLYSSKISQALQGGHLREVDEPEEGEYIPFSKDQEQALDEKEAKKKKAFKFDKDTDPKKMAKAFNFDQLKELAEEHGVEVEEKDTKEMIASAIIESLESEED